MSRSFNGSSDYLSASITGLVAAAPFSVSSWVKPVSFSGGNGVSVGYGESSGSDYWCLFYKGTSSGDGQFERSMGGGAQDTTGGALTVNVWNHLAVVVSTTSNALIYVNGTAGSADTSTQATSNMTELDIGRILIGGTAFDYFDGEIGEVAIWDSALTSTDITNLYGGGTSGANPVTVEEASLIAYYRINPGNVSPEPYYSTYGTVNMTVNGTTSETGDNPPVQAPPSAVVIPPAVTPHRMPLGV